VIDMSGIAILGIGDVLLGDRGVGVHVVRRLAEDGGLPGVDLYDGGMSPFGTLGVFLEHDHVIVLDTVSSGTHPGRVRRIDPETLDAVTEGLRFPDGLGLPDVVRVARELGWRGDLVVLGIEARDSEKHAAISADVWAAIPRLLRAIERELGRVAVA
jgi:hydrogenase maturation protease